MSNKASSSPSFLSAPSRSLKVPATPMNSRHYGPFRSRHQLHAKRRLQAGPGLNSIRVDHHFPAVDCQAFLGHPHRHCATFRLSAQVLPHFLRIGWVHDVEYARGLRRGEQDCGGGFAPRNQRSFGLLQCYRGSFARRIVWRRRWPGQQAGKRELERDVFLRHAIGRDLGHGVLFGHAPGLL